MSTPPLFVSAMLDGELPDAVARHPKNTTAINVARYVTGDGLTDDTDALRAALGDALAARRAIYFPDDLEIGVADTIVFGDTRANSAQLSLLHVEGVARLKARAAIAGPVARLQGTQTWAGAHMIVDGASLADECVSLDTIGRTSGLSLHTHHAKTWGTRVLAVGNNNAVQGTFLRSVTNGTKVTATATATAVTGGGSLSLTTGTFADQASEAGWTQFTLADPVPSHVTAPGAVKFVAAADGTLWRVRNFPDASTINLYNYRPAAGTVVTLTIYAGGGLSADSWGDSGLWSIPLLDLRDNPNGLGMHWGGKYGASIGQLALQNNAIGLASESYMIGFNATAAYFEATGVPMVLNNGVTSRMSLGAGPNSDVDKIQILTNNPTGLTGRGLLPSSIQWHGYRGPQVMTTSRPLNNAGTVDIRPGMSYAFPRTAAGQNVRIDCGQYKDEAARGQDFIDVLCAFASAADTLNVTGITQGSGATHTLNGATTVPVNITIPNGRGLVRFYRVGLDWRYLILPAA